MIKTGRLTIKPFELAHITPEYIGWLNDRKLMRFSGQRFIQHTMASCVDYWRQHSMLGVWREERTLSPAPVMVGTLSMSVDIPNSCVEMGILIADGGKGYGQEAWRAVLKNLTEEYRLVIAGCMAPNKAMVRILEDTMEFCGGVEGRFLYQGKPVDLVQYRKAKDENSNPVEQSR